MSTCPSGCQHVEQCVCSAGLQRLAVNTHDQHTAHVSRGIISNITLFSKWVQGLVSFSHSNSPLDSRLWYQTCATITWSMCRCQATHIYKSFSKCIQKSYLLIAVNSGAALSPHSSSPLHISYTVTSYFQIQIDLFGNTVDNLQSGRVVGWMLCEWMKHQSKLYILN